MSEFQGVRLSEVKWEGIVSKGDLGRAIGNCMSRNILDRLLPRVLLQAGLLRGRSPPIDLWAQGQFPL